MQTNPVTVASLMASEKFQQFCFDPSAEDIRYWKEWLAEHPQQQAIFDEAKQLTEALYLKPSEEMIQAEYLRFKDQLQQQPVRKLPLNKRRYLLQIAAAVAVLVLIGSLWIWQSQPAMIEFRTAYGNTSTYKLQDGSQLILNANSSIRMAETWAPGTNREVWLEGEAFFEVAKAKQPFIVHTKKGNVEVLGTVFNVIQRQEDLNVTLLEGKIQLNTKQENAFPVKPGENAYLNQEGLLVADSVDTAPYTAWRYQKMIFKDATIASIIKRIKDDFGWEVKVKDQQLLQRRVNATIPENNPELLLQALSGIYELNIRTVNDSLFIIE